MENDLLSNKTAAAMLRDSEKDIIYWGAKAVDLRLVDVSAWDRFLDHDVKLSPSVQTWLNGRSGPMSEVEIHAIEKATENWHCVQPPYYITMSLTLQQTGRPWAVVPEAGDCLTGLTLGKRNELS